MAMDTFILSLVALSAYLFAHFLYTRKPGPRPPGPRPLPIIGNLLDLPHDNEWVVYSEWGRKWGNLVMVNVLGKDILIINDSATATSLLERRSAITSDRPYIAMASLAGWEHAISLKNFDDPNFRVQRKMLHKLVGTPALAGNYNHVQEQEMQKFLRSLLKGGKGELMAQIEAATASVVLRMGYGYQVKDANDDYVTLVKNMQDAFIHGSQPHSFLVNLFPPLNRLPNWFPGTGFKEIGAKWRKEYSESIEIPLRFAKRQAATKGNETSMIARLLEEPEGENYQDWEDNVKYAMGALYGAGTDTSASGIHAFFKAMILYPEVQRRAQAEIDALTGGLRLPTVNDHPNLPYVNALVSEVLRWHPIAPLGLSHATSEDMTFGGYWIPKGTLIVPNVWAMCHDPKTYRDPFTFDPARFLPTNGATPERDPRAFVFGYGRRICVGRYLADNSIFLACAMSLAVFDVLPARDDRGEPIIPEVKAHSGLVSRQSSFEYEIKPRLSGSVDLIMNLLN